MNNVTRINLYDCLETYQYARCIARVPLYYLSEIDETQMAIK